MFQNVLAFLGVLGLCGEISLTNLSIGVLIIAVIQGSLDDYKNFKKRVDK